MHEAEIEGDGFRLVIHVVGYENATEDWLTGTVRVEVTGDAARFEARGPAPWTATELAELHRSLSTLVAERTGTVSVSTPGAGVRLTIALEDGGGKIHGHVRESARATLEFADIQTDASFLEPAVRALGKIVAAFPPRR